MGLWNFPDPNLELQRLHMGKMVEGLTQQGRDVTDCWSLLEVVDRNLQRPFWHYSRYDFIVEALHHIRHRLCMLETSPIELLSIACEIHGDIQYLEYEETQTDALNDLEDIRFKLETWPNCVPVEGDADYEKSNALQGTSNELMPDSHGTSPTAAGRGKRSADFSIPRQLRTRLCELSVQTGTAREAYWRKVNRQRTRLLWTAALLVVAIGFAFGILCGGMGGQFANSDRTLHPRWLLAGVVALGVVGGLVSSLRENEFEKQGAANSEIQRLLLWLRPIVGAAAALTIYLVYRSGVIQNMAGVGGNQGVGEGGRLTPPQTAAALVFAFLAGFSERFFVGRLESLVSAPPGANRETAAPATKEQRPQQPSGPGRPGGTEPATRPPSGGPSHARPAAT